MCAHYISSTTLMVISTFVFSLPLFSGVNSFARKSPLQIRDGRFKIVLSKDGKRGFPNELPISIDNFNGNSQGYVMLRLYGVDPLAKNSNPKLAQWGYKDPPTISLRTAGSLTPATFDQDWKKLKQCPSSNAEIIAQAVNTAVQVSVPLLLLPPFLSPFYDECLRNQVN